MARRQLILTFIMLGLFTLFHIISFAADPSRKLYFTIAVSMTLFALIASYILYFCLKKYTSRLTRYYACILTASLNIMLIEVNQLSTTSSSRMDGWIISVSAFSMISTMHYSQIDSFLVYIFNSVYNLIRTYNWLKDSLAVYIRFNIFFMFTFAVIYFFSRAIHQRERDHFSK